MIPAYNGSEPYIFVSYAHKDSEAVYRTIEKLTSLGYRIWYDEGIKPGVEWPENIAIHLDQCSLFMMFISPNSMDSANCRREINFALSRSKKFLCIVLEKTEIPLGMELQLASQQSIFRYKYASEKAYIYKICSAAGMSQCKDTHYFDGASEGPRAAVGTGKKASAASAGNKKRSSSSGEKHNKVKNAGHKSGNSGAVILGILMGSLIIISFLIIMLYSFGKGTDGSDTAMLTVTPTVTVTPSPVETEIPEPTPTEIPVPTEISTQEADKNKNGDQNTGNQDSGKGNQAVEDDADTGEEEEYDVWVPDTEDIPYEDPGNGDGLDAGEDLVGGGVTITEDDTN